MLGIDDGVESVGDRIGREVDVAVGNEEFEVVTGSESGSLDVVYRRTAAVQRSAMVTARRLLTH